MCEKTENTQKRKEGESVTNRARDANQIDKRIHSVTAEQVLLYIVAIELLNTRTKSNNHKTNTSEERFYLKI